MHKTDDTAAIRLSLPDEAATLALGAKLADLLKPGWVVYLRGDLGAGKTTLVRGILRALGYAGRVKSPTYTLVESYDLSRFILQHYDLYRMMDPREWLDAGFRDDCNAGTLCIVEWPEKARGLLPRPDLEIFLEMAGEGRTARIEALSAQGRKELHAWQGFDS
ncbi:tRNA (adenosine(37)-N6)-threonylcarbamoyltransferase complex ATPase subunit type 1 TsaE [Betaproteobacteria bacterium SCN2]|jgi:tRNA threonylcarbamoyladenosine biosynthesis protein TsaE|nr:tRNA (adenosine(37)-N6)-threonylcarbamoyltransferase complex ATPase subunit type 1 TsaE [Betaproteobacteria bacterium SCN2]